MTLSCLALGAVRSQIFAFIPCNPSRKSRAAIACLALASLLCAFAELGFAQSNTATITTLAISSGGNTVSSVTAGSVVTLTAHVAAGGSSVTPGQVNFCDASAKTCSDIHLLGTTQLSAAGTATLKLRPGIGSHSYKARFLGTFASSESGASALTATGTIPPLATTTGINQAGAWGAYTLSATMTATGNTALPTGTISFLDTNHGNAVLATGTLGAATRGVAWSNVSTSAPNLAGVSYAVADLNADGIPDLFVEDYFGTYNVFLGNGDGTFTQKGSAFGPTSQTGSFVLGDFNNDGIPDVAAIDGVIYAANNTITIFLGNGDGTFTVAGSSPAIGYNPASIATADVNGDGNADLILVQQGSSTSSGGQVVVFLGNGNGTFTQASSTTSLASVASSIIPADLNGDRHADLVLAGLGGSGITILLGNGDGTFAAMPTLNQAGEAIPALADVNNDGIPDLVFGAAGTSYLTVLLGNGDGTFTASPQGPSANVVIGNSVAIADLNQDGVPDIAYSNGSTTGILFGNGDGTFFQFPATLSFSTYSFGTSFVIADFNGDGWPDVLAIDGSGRTIATSLTQPTETASASATVSIAAVGTHLAGASYAGDANYNPSISGTIALWGAPPATTTSLAVTSGASAVSSVAPGTVVTLTATVTAGASPVTAGPVNFCDASESVCSDIHLLGSGALVSNGTASFSFIPGPGTHSYKAVFFENGYGLGSSSSAVSLTVGPAPPVVYSDITAISVAGSPGDYSLTATVVGYGGSAAPTGTLSFLDTSFGNSSLGTAALGSATAGVGWLTSQTTAFASTYPITEVAGDFNGDGLPDLAVLWAAGQSGGPDSVTIFFGALGGSFTQGPTFQGQSGQTYISMLSGDFNSDGKADLVLLSNSFASADTVTTYLGNGDGTFGPARTSVVFQQASMGGDYVPGSMIAADLNGDGKLDLAVVGNYISYGGVTALLGNGDGTFTAAGPNAAPTKDFGLVATGDFNGDGIPDLVVTNYFEFGGSPTIFLGKGDGTFTAKSTSFTLDYFPTSVVVGDFNGDGVLDLAFSDLNGVEIALGKGDGAFNETSASPIRVSSELYSLQLGDFNHDGKLDIAGLDNYNDQIVLLIGAGDGTFTATATTPAISPNPLDPFVLVAADFNQDGVPDLAMLTKNQAMASILLTEPTETATATLTGVAPVGAGTHNVQASYPGDNNYPASVSSTAALTAGLKPVTITPAGGSFSSIQTVTITELIPGATIYYQASGVFNTSGFVQYTGPVSLNMRGQETITAYASETGYVQSSYTTVSFALNFPVAAAAPTFSLAAGTYSGAQTLIMADTTQGAAIYYTIDGSNPTTSSSAYAAPITVSSSETVKAIAVATGYTISAVASADYIIKHATDVSAVSSSLNPSMTGNAVTFTVGVSSNAGSPSGTVSFLDGTVQLASVTLSGGSATYTTSALAAGSHTITAVYSGDNAFATVTSAALTQVVESFSIAPSSGSSSTATASPGGQAKYTLSAAPPAAGNPLMFSISGLPAGATATFSPSTVAAGAGATNVTLTISLPASASAVPADRSFPRATWPVVLGLVLLPFAGRLRRASKRWAFSLLLLIAPLAIGFGVSGCGGGSSQQTQPSTQTYTLTVTATSGTLTQSTTLTLVVQQ